MSSEKTPLRHHEESLIAATTPSNNPEGRTLLNDSRHDGEGEATTRRQAYGGSFATAAGPDGLPLTNDSLAYLEENEDDDDDAIDIQQLQEVARKLDIPLSALLQQLQSQQMDDDNGSSCGEGSSSDGDGALPRGDVTEPNRDAEANMLRGGGSLRDNNTNNTNEIGEACKQPCQQQHPSGSNLSYQSEQRGTSSRRSACSITTTRVVVHSGRDQMAAANSLNSPPSCSERKHIRIRGELTDIIDDDDFIGGVPPTIVTSPIGRGAQHRFPPQQGASSSSTAGSGSTRRQQYRVFGSGRSEETATRREKGDDEDHFGICVRDLGEPKDSDAACSDGNESMATAVPLPLLQEDGVNEDDSRRDRDNSLACDSLPESTENLTCTSENLVVGSNKDRVKISTEDPSSASDSSPVSAGGRSNMNFYNTNQVPTKSALSKKASLASNNSSSTKLSGGPASSRRFGLGSGGGGANGRVGGTRERMLKQTSSSGSMSLTGAASASGGEGASATQAKKKKGVRFGELQQVHVFEVDNSLYISIEYSRPLIGWVLLFVGVFLRVFMHTIDVYKLAVDPDAAYGFATGKAIGKTVVCVLLALPIWFFFMKPTRGEARFIKSLPGIGLIGITGLIYALSSVAQQSASRITGQWRSLATFSLHPAIIVLYGKVFKNSVFVEELVGVGVLAVGYFLAMVPTDIRIEKWYFAEIITFAQSIYVSSFLFLAVKSRANRVPVPVTMASVAFFSLVVQLIVCAAAEVPFDASSDHSAFEFLRGQYLGFFFASTLCDVVSLACCLLALRFIPPLTVSTSWVIEPLLTQLVVSFLFFNKDFRVWNLCPEERMKNEGLKIFCGIDAFNPWFACGAFVAVLATGYIIYISSIKRSKVEMLIKKLKKRKTPKNPYKSRADSLHALQQQQQQQQLMLLQQQQQAQTHNSIQFQPQLHHQQQYYRQHQQHVAGEETVERRSQSPFHPSPSPAYNGHSPTQYAPQGHGGKSRGPSSPTHQNPSFNGGVQQGPRGGGTRRAGSGEQSYGSIR